MAEPVAYSVATAATPHPRGDPVGRACTQWRFWARGLPGSAEPSTRAFLPADRRRLPHFTWPAAVVGSNNAAGYQRNAAHR